MLVGALLLVAGAMKLSSTSGYFHTDHLILAGHLYPLFAGWEVLLGMWVLSGWSAHVSRWAVAATFPGFAAVSGYLGWLGVADCGCFGDVPTSPW